MTAKEIKDRLEDYIDEMFIEFQDANGIESGDLPVDLSLELSMATYKLAKQIHDCMEWQNANK